MHIDANVNIHTYLESVYDSITILSFLDKENVEQDEDISGEENLDVDEDLPNFGSYGTL